MADGQKSCSGPYWYHQEGLPRTTKGVKGAIDGPDGASTTVHPVRFSRDDRGGAKAKALEYRKRLCLEVPMWAFEMGRKYSVEGAITVANHGFDCPPAKRQICEVLQELPTKFYLDLDGAMTPASLQLVLQSSQLADFLLEIDGHIRTLAASIFGAQFPRALEPVILESHKKDKLSLHLVYNEVVLASPQYVSVFFDEVKALVQHPLGEFMDACVYHPGRIFRCYGQTKPREMRPLRWLRGPVGLTEPQRFLVSCLQCGMRFSDSHVGMGGAHEETMAALPLVTNVLGQRKNTLAEAAAAKHSGHNRVENIPELMQKSYDYCHDWIIKQHGAGCIIKSGVEKYSGLDFLTFQIVPGRVRCYFHGKPHRNNTTWVKFRLDTKEVMYKCMDTDCGQALFGRKTLAIPDKGEKRGSKRGRGWLNVTTI
tara:strand:+ start:4510 stop:5784 length:1275 start_codon:yes stop_codon:yes gene_type:complete